MLCMLLMISFSTAHAASTAVNSAAPVLDPQLDQSPAASGVIAITSPTPQPPAPKPFPLKLSYFAEYDGPRLSNLNLLQYYQGPIDPYASYAGIAQSLKVGYAVSSDVVLGTQIRTNSPFDPTANFAFKNLRFYVSWKHMIDTPDLDMQGVVDVEIPNSAGSRAKGLIVAFDIKNNWTLKTSFRNWSFSALTLIKPKFYNNPVGQSDLDLGIFPEITLDIAADWELQLNGSFDTTHSYSNGYFVFGHADDNYIAPGIQYAVNAYIQVAPALKFYTADLTVPTIYMLVSAAL